MPPYSSGGLPPLISILVPLYNHAPFVEQCLDSVLCDPYPHKELVVLDDGSTDDSLAVAQAWAARHAHRPMAIRVLTQPNAGLSKALNRLVREARGELLCFCASDDYLLPGGLEARARALEAHPEWRAVFGDSRVVDDAGATVHASSLSGLYKAELSALRDPALIGPELVLFWCLPGSVTMMRRTAFRGPGSVGFFDESLLIEDRDFYLRLLERGYVGFLDAPVAAYRLHPNNSFKNAARAHAYNVQCARVERRFVGRFSRTLSLALWLNALRIEGYDHLHHVRPAVSVKLRLKLIEAGLAALRWQHRRRIPRQPAQPALSLAPS